MTYPTTPAAARPRPVASATAATAPPPTTSVCTSVTPVGATQVHEPVLVKLKVVYPPDVVLDGAQAVVTVKLPEVTEVRPVLAKVRVYVPSAAVMPRFVNVATPATAFGLVVPISVPPALTVAVTVAVDSRTVKLRSVTERVKPQPAAFAISP